MTKTCNKCGAQFDTEDEARVLCDACKAKVPAGETPVTEVPATETPADSEPTA